MEKVSEVLKDKPLRPDELGGKPRVIRVDGVEWVTFDDGRKTRLTFQFDGEERERTMNKTNMRELARLFGDDPLGWIGREVTFIPSRVQFKEKVVPTILVAAADEKPAARPQAEKPEVQTQSRKPVPWDELRKELDNPDSPIHREILERYRAAEAAPPEADPSDPGPDDADRFGVESDELPDWRKEK